MKMLLALLLQLPLFLHAQQNIVSTIETIEVESGRRTVVLSRQQHIEAPNWSKDGNYLVVNSGGSLFRLNLGDTVLTRIETGFADHCNNDHGISPDGQWIVLSHNQQYPSLQNRSSTLYLVPIQGGEPRLVTPQHPSYWHGWSPDGKTIAYVGERTQEGKKDYDIYGMHLDTLKEFRLTFAVGLDDGPDYSPDGRYIYFNSYRSGRMQIWRMDTNGRNAIRLTNDTLSNWFPHPSPDGRYIVFLSYLQDQKQDHPFGKQVKLRLMETGTGKIKDLTQVFTGGQGTINVPSWSPDGQRLAFITYSIAR